MRGPSRWSLRSRLALVTAVLAALGLVVADGVGLALYRAYLVGQVDERVSRIGSGMSDVSPEVLARLRGIVDQIGPARVPGIDTDEFRLYAVTPEGAHGLLASGRPGPDLPSRERLAGHAGKGPFTVPGVDGGADWRVQVGRGGTGDVLLVGASSLRQVESIFQRLVAIDVAVLLVALAALSLLARMLVGIGLRPLSRMEETAGQIAAGDYSRRVADVDPHTEPGRLGRAVNVMLGRVESEINARKASEERMRRFLADASHELRTPLTSVRGFAELAQRGGPAAESLARIEAEAERMGLLVDDLLLLARLDEQRPLESAPVDLLELAADLVRDVHAQGRLVTLSGLDPDSELFEPVIVPGDGPRLRQVVANLLDNAVRHTPAEASIALRIGSTVREALIEVADTGPGIAPEDAPHVFERLYRADRSRSAEGSGLGLSIAAAITEAHGGRVELAGTPGGGATFRVFLPVPSSL
ncbi:HAMP domain-containing sensor histidine kinase [Actinocorallia longicatena]|uniref:histidine kinase n=1 Tax=Actinocorallia longicatena TaxID=111803 RepID=A0ABP6Q6H4_9ACTN